MRHSFTTMGLTTTAFITATFITTMFSTAAYAQSRQDRYDDAECQSYGAMPGSEAYVNCRLRLKQRADEQIRGAFQRGPVYVPAPIVTPTPNPRNCITNYIGGSAYTTCN